MSGPSQIDAWLHEGLRLFEQGERARALELWHRVLNLDGMNAQALEYIALVGEHSQPPGSGSAAPGSASNGEPQQSAPLATARAGRPASGEPAPPGALKNPSSATRDPRDARDAVLAAPPQPAPHRSWDPPAESPLRASLDGGSPPPDGAPGAVPEAAASLAPSVASLAPSAAEATNPWDALDDGHGTIDLDRTPVSPSLFDRLLAAADGPGLALAPMPSEPGPPAPPAAAASDASAADECADLMEGARELFALGDFSGSLERVEQILALDPNHEGARAYLERNEETLLKMYQSKLGNLQKAPKLTPSPDEVIWMNLHHRAGFLLSQIDGELTYEDLAVVSGMSRLDTFRILAELVQSGVIT